MEQMNNYEEQLIKKHRSNQQQTCIVSYMTSQSDILSQQYTLPRLAPFQLSPLYAYNLFIAIQARPVLMYSIKEVGLY